MIGGIDHSGRAKVHVNEWYTLCEHRKKEPGGVDVALAYELNVEDVVEVRMRLPTSDRILNF